MFHANPLRSQAPEPATETENVSAPLGEGSYGTKEQEMIVKHKLANPQHVFRSVDESIDCLLGCVEYGKGQAKIADARHAIVIIGNTGAGTFLAASQSAIGHFENSSCRGTWVCISLTWPLFTSCHHERRLVNEIRFKMSAKWPGNSGFRNGLFKGVRSSRV